MKYEIRGKQFQLYLFCGVLNTALFMIAMGAGIHVL